MISRRTFLTAGLAGSAALAAAWWLRGPGEPAPAAANARTLAGLDAAAPAIVAAVARVMLDGALPEDPAERASAVGATVAGVDRAVAGMPPTVQHELGQLFALLGFAPTRAALAHVGPWAAANDADVAAFLDQWRDSRFALLHSAYNALHQLVFAAWYGNPASWPAIGYAGPPAL